MRPLLIFALCSTLLACSTTGFEPSVSSELANTSWRLVQVMEMDDSVHRPAENASFTLEFGADGRAAIQADCNRGSGTWQSPGPGVLTFGPLATTRAFCGEESVSDYYLSQFQWIRSYVIQNGRLYLATLADGAIIEFAPFP